MTRRQERRVSGTPADGCDENATEPAVCAQEYIAAMSGRGIAFLTFHLIYNCLISRHPYRGGSDVEDSG